MGVRVLERAFPFGDAGTPSHNSGIRKFPLPDSERTEIDGDSILLAHTLRREQHAALLSRGPVRTWRSDGRLLGVRLPRFRSRGYALVR